jgi:hypothetical protein
MIMGSEGKTEEIIKEFASNHKKLSGEGYVSPQTGVKGVMIFDPDNPAITLDIFIGEDKNKPSIGTSETEDD